MFAGADNVKESQPLNAVPRKPDVEEDYGYGYYPSRSRYPQKLEEKPANWFSRERRAASEFQCASNVVDCMKNSKLKPLTWKCKQFRYLYVSCTDLTDPMVKLLLSGLKKHGWLFTLLEIVNSFYDFNPKRHVSCEDCVSKVNGGYDLVNNQIVICKNNSASKTVCCRVLTHELIHMFDACRAKLDFKNIDHTACTEIRAAAICHCRFMTAMNDGFASFFNFKNRHQKCVKEKAILSVIMVRNVTYEEASAAVERVFVRCYNDLEPFGRIPRMGSTDSEKMYLESIMHGY